MVSGRRSLGVDRQHDGCGGRGEPVDAARGVDCHLVGAVAVVGAGEICARHVDPEGFVIRCGRGSYVTQTDLVVDIVVGVVTPIGVVQGQGSRRCGPRSTGGCGSNAGGPAAAGGQPEAAEKSEGDSRFE